MFRDNKTVNWGKDGKSINITSPLTMPKASHFLWNKKMVAQVNCRGYMISQFMQPEPAKYSHGPNLEAKTFIQPEQPFYTDHPGRFFFVKDHASGDVVSLPYEPMRRELNKFSFHTELSEVRWVIEHFSCRFEIGLSLDQDSFIEHWSLTVSQLPSAANVTIKHLSIYSSFSIGYMSWMNQSADFEPDLNAIIATSISPYQKVDEYPAIKKLNDKTFLMTDRTPESWCCSFSDFVGEGGIVSPDALSQTSLAERTVSYETPIAVIQHDVRLTSSETESFKFLFGPANNDVEIAGHKRKLSDEYFAKVKDDAEQYLAEGLGTLTFNSPNTDLNHVINHWLPRQAFYHGDVNRLSTDPQTRNYLQDAMGMIYLKPDITRERILFALKQQAENGEMPDGILLSDEAELKYINQVPHADHNVWLSLVLLAYLEQTGDVGILDEPCEYANGAGQDSVATHLEKAQDWLLSNTNEEGLSLIAQGDWCDPMNMVGHKGNGVSTWLTLATAYSIQCWLEVVEQFKPNYEQQKIAHYKSKINELNGVAKKHFHDGRWFGRGITDDGRLFGTELDTEGKMFLNAQSWSMLSGLTQIKQEPNVLTQINQHLLTPYGFTMLAPSYTNMVEDIGRITQKSPGVSENGSVYNHAAIFYSYALFKQGLNDQAFDVFQRMIALPNSELTRDQLPNFVPNYYRGAYFQFPDYAGRSSNLFNTGTISWLMRIVNENLCGFKGLATGVHFQPQIPSFWSNLNFIREFRGAEFSVSISRSDAVNLQQTSCNGQPLEGNILAEIVPGKRYQIDIILPCERLMPPQLNIIMGVSGSGKSTVAQALAKDNNVVFIDADDFHSKQARTQMAKGIPLEDNYREVWIAKLVKYLRSLRSQNQHCVLAYSGLKSVQRANFRQLDFDLKFIKLNVSRSELQSRLATRSSHFFDPKLLDSQLKSMEDFSAEETDVININADGEIELVLQEIKDNL